MLDIKEYFPDVLKDVREFNVLDEAETPELKSLYECIAEVLDNGFIETAKEKGVARAEKIVGISPKATTALADRKIAVLAKYNENLPYTVRKLQEVLDTLCGENKYTLEIKNNDFTLNVEIELESKNSKPSVEELLERVAPVNMVLHVTLKYNRYEDMARLTYGQLAKYRCGEIKEAKLTTNGEWSNA